MNEPARFRPGDTGRPDQRWLRLLAVVFTVTASASLVLVAVDLLIGRPAAGDLFITFLNALVAGLLWRWTYKPR
ncbi:cell shape-determining protein MreD [Paenarthrobacter nitroguajacolicus]|uniref:hypothetical protein n=1 Tax=Micrococcaceae TaxID=1268 RepID=UPI0007496A13|nr:MULTISPECIES: hypothetical protein [Micrococcaceae]KUM36475.1 hypothetical protein AR689_21410 [Arthrobacter sp. EpRS71]MDR6989110.1 cell shape-determining protein MreD [Paenarthrobacter nitroguajacolicus]